MADDIVLVVEQENDIVIVAENIVQSSGVGFVSVDEDHFKGDGTFENPIGHSEKDDILFNYFVGTPIYEIDVQIVVIDGKVYAIVQRAGGGDIVYKSSTGYNTFDCTPPQSIELTAGTDSIPIQNWVYILATTNTLAVSTTGFPSAGHCPILDRGIPSPAFVISDGTFPGHNWTDHTWEPGKNGHNTHVGINFRLREPDYEGGMAFAYTGNDTNVVNISVTSGKLLINHIETTPAFPSPADFFILNDNLLKLNNLFDITTDTEGGTLNNRWAAHFLMLVFCEAGCSRLMLNKPSGSYTSADAARNDDEGYLIQGFPEKYRGLTKGIWRIIAKRTVSSLIIDYKSGDDWRTKSISASGGGGGAAGGGTIFDDQNFELQNFADITKTVGFSLEPITPGEKRIITVPDKNITLGMSQVVTSLESPTEALKGQIRYIETANSSTRYCCMMDGAGSWDWKILIRQTW